MHSISAQQLAERAASNEVELIDVRTPVEYREIHAPAAKNVPLDSLDPRAIIESRNGNADEPLYVMCRSGGRSAKAYQKFIDSGFEQIVNVEGGIQAWEAAKLPVVRGKKAISLERQVRIAAGFLVLVGAVLSFLVNPAFIWLSAFIGAGLMFAGITDTCGMGMMLAKMPWNRVKDCESGACSTT